MLKKIAAVTVGLMVAGAVAQAAVNTDWMGFNLTNEAGAPLAAGSIVQLVNAGANKAPDDLTVRVAEGLIGGDDWIVDVARVGDGGAGDGNFYAYSGAAYANVAQGDFLFIRAFNAASLDGLGSVYYGQGGLRSGFADPTGVPPPAPDSVIWDPGATTTFFLIPEPGTILLALAGGLMLVRKLRK